MSVHDTTTHGAQYLRALARYPGRTAFSSNGQSWTYAASADLLGRLQSVLLGLGLPPRSCIAFLSSNRADAWLIGVAASLCGFTTTWLHPLGGVDDQLFQIEDSQSLVLIVDSDKFGDRGRELAAKAIGVTVIFSVGGSDFGRNILQEADAAGSVSPRCLATPDDPCSLFYTGGSTGRPKGVLRLHRQFAYFASANLANFDIAEVPQFLAVTPLSHVASAMVLPTLIRGGTVHTLEQFDPELMLSTIERERINLTLLVPTLIYTLLDHPAVSHTDLSSLQLLLYGAAPITPGRLAQGIERFGRIFSQLYGQSEINPITILSKQDHDLRQPDLLLSCGHPAVGCDVRLVDEQDQDVPTGEAGEILARAPQAMLEYWRQPELTAETLKGGWVHTGDIGRRDERGFLYIVDRKKDMIVSGGFNIYSREVEDVISRHQDVAMVAVIGRPHPKWGEAVTAFVVPKPHTTISTHDIIQLVKTEKSAMFAPKDVQFVTSLPLTALGKIDKKELKARLEAPDSAMHETAKVAGRLL